MSLPNFIPQILTEDISSTLQKVIRVLNDAQTQLQNIFTTISKKPQLDSLILPNIVLKPGLNQIPHTLGHTLNGWSLVGQSAAASIYDQQANNKNPQTYLFLVSDKLTMVNILVF